MCFLVVVNLLPPRLVPRLLQARGEAGGQLQLGKLKAPSHEVDDVSTLGGDAMMLVGSALEDDASVLSKASYSAPMPSVQAQAPSPLLEAAQVWNRHRLPAGSVGSLPPLTQPHSQFFHAPSLSGGSSVHSKSMPLGSNASVGSLGSMASIGGSVRRTKGGKGIIK